MPAISAIAHAGAPSSQSIELYFNTSTGQAGLSLASGTQAPDEHIVYASGENDYRGYILNPSQMAAAKFRGVNMVVAATTPNAHPITVNQISIVCPVYQMLTTTTLANKKLAMSSNDDSAWVYFLYGTSSNDVSIKQCEMHNEYSIQTVIKHEDVTLNSSLGAWYDTVEKKRYIVYQEVNEGSLKEYNVTEKQPHNLNISDAMPLTPIGVTFHNGKVYLYYVDRSNHLHRVIKNGKVWGSPTRVENAPTVAQDSQVAVTTSNNINHIFYVEKEEYYKHPTTPKITHFRDSIA